MSEREKYKCHLCSFENFSSEELAKHMNVHFDHKCPFCDYTSRTEGRLKHHVKNFHSDIPPNTWAGSRVQRESSLDVSDAGSDGDDPASLQKPRKHTCKQCGYVAMNKLDFWKHTESHIRPDKKLTCPHCPFVTEYKHHLEYHLRNHLASKPFKCEKCNYCCVNKSMLNSHLKSHSNIYQYRCNDCSYATKYCHSLKLHLRKYRHSPATVLNLDGTPNPYPIIDVYGTRRGPRPKKNKDANNESNNEKKEDPLTSLLGMTSIFQIDSSVAKMNGHPPINSPQSSKLSPQQAIQKTQSKPAPTITLPTTSSTVTNVKIPQASPKEVKNGRDLPTLFHSPFNLDNPLQSNLLNALSDQNFLQASSRANQTRHQLQRQQLSPPNSLMSLPNSRTSPFMNNHHSLPCDVVLPMVSYRVGLSFLSFPLLPDKDNLCLEAPDVNPFLSALNYSRIPSPSLSGSAPLDLSTKSSSSSTSSETNEQRVEHASRRKGIPSRLTKTYSVVSSSSN